MKKGFPKCFYYGELNESLQKASNGMVQVRGTCEKCDAWIMWVPYSASSVVSNVLLREVLK